MSSSGLRLSSLQECFYSSPLSSKVFTVSLSSWFFLTVPGALNDQLEPSQSVAVKSCHAYLICMAHPPRKPEVRSVINFPSVFQFCHWYSFSFLPTVKGTTFQVQRLNKRVWVRWHHMSCFPHSWRSTCSLAASWPSADAPNSLVLYVMLQMEYPALNHITLFLYRCVSCIFL